MEETGEVGALHSKEQLEEMQRLPLSRKIQITTARIIEWYQHYDGQVYVAFSGGKDSTEFSHQKATESKLDREIPRKSNEAARQKVAQNAGRSI